MNFLDSYSAFLSEAEVKSNMKPPSSLPAIQKLEKELGQQDRIRGFRMPPSYQAFLLRWDGGSIDEEEGAEAHVHFFSVAEDEVQRASLMDYNGSDTVLMNHQIEEYFSLEPLVVFAMDEGSNFWAFDPRQKRSDGEMPVRYCDNETGDIYAQSDDFASFIRALSSHQLRYRGLEDPIEPGNL